MKNISSIFDELNNQLNKIASEKIPDGENKNMALEGQNNLINSGKKDSANIVAPADVKEGLDKKDLPCEEEENGTIKVLNSGEKPNVSIVVPKSEKDEIKKIAKEVEKAVLSYAAEAEKTAGIKVTVSEDSIMYKAASALKGAIEIIEKAENEMKIASIARDFLDHNLAENYEDSLRIIKSAHSKLNEDFSATETWVNNQKLAFTLTMSSGLTDQEMKQQETAYEAMERYLRG